MFEHIDLFWFILAFAVSMFYIYVSNPEPKVVMKFPSPFNADEVTYRDSSNTCYKFKAEKKVCPKNSKMVRPQPIIEEDFKDKYKGNDRVEPFPVGLPLPLETYGEVASSPYGAPV
jgi:hypothetical protein